MKNKKLEVFDDTKFADVGGHINDIICDFLVENPNLDVVKKDKELGERILNSLDIKSFIKLIYKRCYIENNYFTVDIDIGRMKYYGRYKLKTHKNTIKHFYRSGL